jgi:hypothetical protein
MNQESIVIAVGSPKSRIISEVVDSKSVPDWLARRTIEVKLRPTVSRPVRLGVGHPFGTRDLLLFFLFHGLSPRATIPTERPPLVGEVPFLVEIFFGQLSVCYFVAPSLTRGRVCNLLLLLVLVSAVPFGSESRGTQDHILLSQFLRLPQPGEPGPRIYIPQELDGPDIPLGTGFARRTEWTGSTN